MKDGKKLRRWWLGGPCWSGSRLGTTEQRTREAEGYVSDILINRLGNFPFQSARGIISRV